MTENKFAIEIEALKFGYGKKSKNIIEENEVIHSLSAQIPSGKITVIAGPNGSGKSTLLKLIMGFEKEWAGTIKINEGEVKTKAEDKKEISKIEKKDLATLISFVPQTRNIPDTTVEKLVLAGRFPHTTTSHSIFPHSYKKEDYRIAEESMRKMGILQFAERELSELSGGQRQKVYLAMTLAQSTPILVLDEPLTYLDIKQQLELVEILKKLKDEGKTIILVIHDLNMALTIADNFILIDQGRVIAQGSPTKIAELGFIDKVFGIKTNLSGSKGFDFTLV